MVTIDFRFVLSTSPNPTVFYPPELCYRATGAVQKTYWFLCTLLQYISKFISLFEETPPAELIIYICLTEHGGYTTKKSL
jgi:hypothetical protein